MKTVDTEEVAVRHLKVAWVSEHWPVPLKVVERSAGERNAFLRLSHPRGLRPEPCGGQSLRARDARRPDRAFTLIELLVVIAIIAILAGLLLPVLSKVQEKGKITQVKTEIQGLVAAITAYEGDYSVWPFGDKPTPITTDTTFTNNSEIMVILLDVDSGENAGSARNPRHTVYLQVKDATSGLGSGLDGSNVYYDPWGVPYEITMDVDGDNKCPDPSDSNDPPRLISRPILVRSYGPDRTPNTEDDIASWK